MHHVAREWIPENGFLFEVTGSPLVFEIEYAEQFYHWAQTYKRVDSMEYDRDFGYEMAMRLQFPWDELAKHFGGAHFGGGRGDDFTDGWDVESTV